DGRAYMNIRFFNTNLSFQLYPFMSKDQNGRSRYDMKAGQSTTVNFEGAFALWKAGSDILDHKINELHLVVPCPNGASLILERHANIANDGYITQFVIQKNNAIIQFQ